MFFHVYFFPYCLFADTSKLVLLLPDDYFDNEPMDIPVMDDVTSDSGRYDPVSSEVIPDTQDTSLPEEDLPTDGDVACTQESLGSMGVHDLNTKDREDGIQVKLVLSIKSTVSDP